MSIKIAKAYATVEGIRKGLKSVSARHTSWKNDTQALGLACMNHAQIHGDWTLICEFVDTITVSAGVYKAKVTGWASTYMHGEFSKGEKGGLVFKYDEGHDKATIDLEGAAAAAWHEYKAPVTDKSKTLDEIRESVFKMLVAASKSGKVTDAEGAAILDAIDAQLEERAALEVLEAA
jgi:hypothetical protein